MAVGEVVGGAFLSAFLQVLFDRLASWEAVDFFTGKESIVELLNELKTTLFSADLLLDDAEKKLVRDRRVKMWLDELKETIYAADDLVYKIDTEALRKEQEGESRSSNILSKSLSLFQTADFDKAIKLETGEILGKLKVLLEPKNNPGLKFVENKKLPPRAPAPRLKESDVYGRDADKEAVVKLLLSDDGSGGDNLSVILIVGMGGIGKTTLAHLVYKDERVNKSFDTKAWVTIGDDKVDCLKVMRRIIEQVRNSEECKIQEEYVLQDKLEEALAGKKFLVVIDDVWDKDPRNWDVLKNALTSELRGSKIIVTTRSKGVALSMKARSIYHLHGVSNNYGWQLFAKHALIDVNSEEYSNLQKIGRDIVEKCKGLPLAIKSLSGLLALERNENKWVDILTSDTWELDESKSTGILPALWLSYYYLPSHLKSCFAYCALFPKDYKFKKEKLILLWMAEGLLHSTAKKRMEDVGEEYFQDLMSMSFFQPLSGRDSDLLVMHDLIHDLAIFVSGEFCLQMDDAKFSNCAHKVRHFSYGGVDEPKKFEDLSKSMGLRTFLMLPELKSGKPWSLQIDNLLESSIPKGCCLRVLSLSRCDITKLPNSIGDLIYLKYLDLSFNPIEEVPNTMCNLYNLQTLLLEDCRVTHLPMNIGNLIKLRHLHIPYYLKEMPLQIGKMENLQTLNGFVVGENRKSGLKLLKKLQDLHGALQIRGLENVADAKDVLEAELENKKFLTELSLNCDSGYARDDLKKEREVLGALKPHVNLKNLEIYNYKGTNFPDWVGDGLFSNLVKMSLSKCKNCRFLPPLGQLSSLKRLEISHFLSVVGISSEFYYSDVGSPPKTKPFQSLESLHITEMSNLKAWSFVEGGVFPCLKELNIGMCPTFDVSLPDNLPSLRKLKIYGCYQLLPLIPRARSQPVDAAFPCLETLTINECDGQSSLLKGGLPSSLKEISVFGCENLTSLDNEAFQHLPSLNKLEIRHCVKFWRLPKALPTSLSSLHIFCCPLLKGQLERETGKYWSIIEHIPSLTILPEAGYTSALQFRENPHFLTPAGHGLRQGVLGILPPRARQKVYKPFLSSLCRGFHSQTQSGGSLGMFGDECSDPQCGCRRHF